MHVFPPVEPSHGDGAARVSQNLAGHNERLGEIVEQLGLGGGVELRLVLRGHLSRVQDAQHLLPAIGGVGRVERCRERVDAEAAVGVIGVVARCAMLVQERQRGGCHGWLDGQCSRKRLADGQRSGEHNRGDREASLNRLADLVTLHGHPDGT